MRFFLLYFVLLGGGLTDAASSAFDDLQIARYTPYADWTVMAAEEIKKMEVSVWWRSPEDFRRLPRPTDAPLDGLHLALDPGHLGGMWAEWEGRNFRIEASDHWVREGELVLEVAQRVKTQLEALGARVTLLRDSAEPVNPKSPADYWEGVAESMSPPAEWSLAAQVDHALAIRDRAVQRAIVVGEIAERARLVNERIQPDALISLHINAAAWPDPEVHSLVSRSHAHVLIFGCLSDAELASARQRTQFLRKLANGSGAAELDLGHCLASSLGRASALPASVYGGENAVLLDVERPYLWARNLMLLRMVECPVILLEPYLANSTVDYPRIQDALASRAQGRELEPGDILLEYADAVVAGVLQAYTGSD